MKCVFGDFQAVHFGGMGGWLDDAGHLSMSALVFPVAGPVVFCSHS